MRSSVMYFGYIVDFEFGLSCEEFGIREKLFHHHFRERLDTKVIIVHLLVEAWIRTNFGYSE